jgi:hypothetical protein
MRPPEIRSLFWKARAENSNSRFETFERSYLRGINCWQQFKDTSRSGMFVLVSLKVSHIYLYVQSDQGLLKRRQKSSKKLKIYPFFDNSLFKKHPRRSARGYVCDEDTCVVPYMVFQTGLTFISTFSRTDLYSLRILPFTYNYNQSVSHYT